MKKHYPWLWFDADDQIERRAGKSIAEIFADNGEQAFRDLESQVVGELSRRDRVVLAVGGGAVLRVENREAIKRQGRVVWLTASPETHWRRITEDQATASRRPNLTASGGITEIVATLAARQEIYRACADFEVDTDDRTPGQVADAILTQWDLKQASDEPA